MWQNTATWLDRTVQCGGTRLVYAVHQTLPSLVEVGLACETSLLPLTCQTSILRGFPWMWPSARVVSPVSNELLCGIPILFSLLAFVAGDMSIDAIDRATLHPMTSPQILRLWRQKYISRGNKTTWRVVKSRCICDHFSVSLLLRWLQFSGWRFDLLHFGELGSKLNTSFFCDYSWSSFQIL